MGGKVHSFTSNSLLDFLFMLMGTTKVKNIRKREGKGVGGEDWETTWKIAWAFLTINGDQTPMVGGFVKKQKLEKPL